MGAAELTLGSLRDFARAAAEQEEQPDAGCPAREVLAWRAREDGQLQALLAAHEGHADEVLLDAWEIEELSPRTRNLLLLGVLHLRVGAEYARKLVGAEAGAQLLDVIFEAGAVRCLQCAQNARVDRSGNPVLVLLHNHNAVRQHFGKHHAVAVRTSDEVKEGWTALCSGAELLGGMEVRPLNGRTPYDLVPGLLWLEVLAYTAFVCMAPTCDHRVCAVDVRVSEAAGLQTAQQAAREAADAHTATAHPAGHVQQQPVFGVYHAVAMRGRAVAVVAALCEAPAGSAVAMLQRMLRHDVQQRLGVPGRQAVRVPEPTPLTQHTGMWDAEQLLDAGRFCAIVVPVPPDDAGRVALAGRLGGARAINWLLADALFERGLGSRLHRMLSALQCHVWAGGWAGGPGAWLLSNPIVLAAAGDGQSHSVPRLRRVQHATLHRYASWLERVVLGARRRVRAGYSGVGRVSEAQVQALRPWLRVVWPEVDDQTVYAMALLVLVFGQQEVLRAGEQDGEEEEVIAPAALPMLEAGVCQSEIHVLLQLCMLDPTGESVYAASTFSGVVSSCLLAQRLLAVSRFRFEAEQARMTGVTRREVEMTAELVRERLQSGTWFPLAGLAVSTHAGVEALDPVRNAAASPLRALVSLRARVHDAERAETALSTRLELTRHPDVRYLRGNGGGFVHVWTRPVASELAQQDLLQSLQQLERDFALRLRMLAPDAGLLVGIGGIKAAEGCSLAGADAQGTSSASATAAHAASLITPGLAHASGLADLLGVTCDTAGQWLPPSEVRERVFRNAAVLERALTFAAAVDGVSVAAAVAVGTTTIGHVRTTDLLALRVTGAAHTHVLRFLPDPCDNGGPVGVAAIVSVCARKTGQAVRQLLPVQLSSGLAAYWFDVAPVQRLVAQHLRHIGSALTGLAETGWQRLGPHAQRLRLWEAATRHSNSALAPLDALTTVRGTWTGSSEFADDGDDGDSEDGEDGQGRRALTYSIVRGAHDRALLSVAKRANRSCLRYVEAQQLGHQQHLQRLAATSVTTRVLRQLDHVWLPRLVSSDVLLPWRDLLPETPPGVRSTLQAAGSRVCAKFATLTVPYLVETAWHRVSTVYTSYGIHGASDMSEAELQVDSAWTRWLVAVRRRIFERISASGPNAGQPGRADIAARGGAGRDDGGTDHEHGGQERGVRGQRRGDSGSGPHDGEPGHDIGGDAGVCNGGQPAAVVQAVVPQVQPAAAEDVPAHAGPGDQPGMRAEGEGGGERQLAGNAGVGDSGVGDADTDAGAHLVAASVRSDVALLSRGPIDAAELARALRDLGAALGTEVVVREEQRELIAVASGAAALPPATAAVLMQFGPGAGKSLAPVLLVQRLQRSGASGIVLCVVPLLTLAQDMYRRMVSLRGLPVLLWTPQSRRGHGDTCMSSEQVALWLCTPEALSSGRELARVLAGDSDLLAGLVVDECHEALAPYRSLLPLIEPVVAHVQMCRCPLLLLTATLRRRERVLLAHALRIPRLCLVLGQLNRPRLKISVSCGTGEDVVVTAARRLVVQAAFEAARHGGGRIFVYLASPSRVEAWHAIEGAGVDVVTFRVHGDMSVHEKQRVIDSFARDADDDAVTGRVRMLVATTAASMGVSVSRVHSVFVCGLPLSISSFYQCIGRGAREPEIVTNVCLVTSQNDYRDAIARARQSQGAAIAVRDVHDMWSLFVQWYVDQPRCRREALLTMLGASDVVFCDGDAENLLGGVACDACEARGRLGRVVSVPRLSQQVAVLWLAPICEKVSPERVQACWRYFAVLAARTCLPHHMEQMLRSLEAGESSAAACRAPSWHCSRARCLRCASTSCPRASPGHADACCLTPIDVCYVCLRAQGGTAGVCCSTGGWCSLVGNGVAVQCAAAPMLAARVVFDLLRKLENRSVPLAQRSRSMRILGFQLQAVQQFVEQLGLAALSDLHFLTRRVDVTVLPQVPPGTT